MVLLDTDVIIAMLRDRDCRYCPAVARVPDEERATSSITIGELLVGVERAVGYERQKRLIETEVIGRLTVLPFGLPAARQYARVRAELERAGNPLDDADLQIAAIALAGGLTLITGNVRHFGRIPGLQVENSLE